MYFCGDKEVRELLRRTDFLPVQFASVHGAAAFLDEQVNRIGKGCHLLEFARTTGH